MTEAIAENGTGNKLKNTPPTIFVIFGATGDLFRRKLLPALFRLERGGFLPREWKLIACGRRPFGDKSFRDELLPILVSGKNGVAGSAPAFLERVYYHQGFFDDPKTYEALGSRLSSIDADFKICSNKLFYLAVPPDLYELILKRLAHSGLTIPCGGGEGWTRVLVEKPFGKDLKSAKRLDRMLGELFKEEQIFRIDHYLAKETMQNILAFRFGNTFFEPLWSNKHIEEVIIKLWEKEGVGARGNFYRNVGALRDVGQNHLLQMLSLIAMSEPKNLSAEAVRAERARVLKALMPFDASHLPATTRGYYEGFREEAGIGTDDATETYFRLPAFLRLPRWRGVPFFLESGKALGESRAEITIVFKETKFSPDTIHAKRNFVTIRIQPREGISVIFWAKKPGLSRELESRELSFNYEKSEGNFLPDAYEKVLYDCIRGDQTLFASTDEVMAAWKFVMSVLSGWGRAPLVSYKKGVNGPPPNQATA